MKIQIIDDPKKAIENYEIVLFSEIDKRFNEISNNECEFILANDIFDYVTTQQIPAILQFLLLKLRVGGTMVVGGKDLQMFCKHVNNGLINEETASQLISTCKSFSNYLQVRDIINSMGLFVQSIQLNGIHYEITAVRQVKN